MSIDKNTPASDVLYARMTDIEEAVRALNRRYISIITVMVVGFVGLLIVVGAETLYVIDNIQTARDNINVSLETLNQELYGGKPAQRSMMQALGAANK
jgi:hypothetical protein